MVKVKVFKGHRGLSQCAPLAEHRLLGLIGHQWVGLRGHLPTTAGKRTRYVGSDNGI